MIKPSEIVTKSEVLNTDAMAALERHADAAIREAESTGQWPAAVTVVRMAITQPEVQAVATRYTAEGWRVELTLASRRGRDTYMTIDPPAPLD